MNYGLYCFRDHLGAFGAPFAHLNDNTAKRYFATVIANSTSEIGFAPADYDLCKVAVFNDANGLVSVVNPVEYICNGVDVYHEK